MWQVDEKEARRLLEDLIKIDSTNPSLVPGGAGEQAAAEYIMKYLQTLGLEAWLDQVAPGRPNVIGVLPASAGRGNKHGLLLNGHLDTVAKSEPDQLCPRSEGDQMYGLGSGDMKGGLVMTLLALKAVKESGITLGKSVLFAGAVDEEYASIGTEDVVRRYTADAGIVTEPTGLEIEVAHKGFAWVTVETRGRAAHGSRYLVGIDAIGKMGKVLVELEHLSRQYLAGERHPLVGHRSVHASLIEGGKELSTYPDYCRLQIERRTLPAEDPAVAARELEEVCARLAAEDPDFQADVTLDFTRQGYEIDVEEPIVKTLHGAFKTITGVDPGYRGTTGWLDSALMGAAGIPTVIFGPCADGAHAVGERVSLESIVIGARVLAETIVRVCGS